MINTTERDTKMYSAKPKLMKELSLELKRLKPLFEELQFPSHDPESQGLSFDQSTL